MVDNGKMDLVYDKEYDRNVLVSYKLVMVTLLCDIVVATVAATSN